MLRYLYRAGVCVVMLAALCFAQARGRGGSVTPSDPNAPKGVYPTAHGTIKSLSGSQLFVEVDEDHEMKFRLIHKTKIYIQNKDSKGALKEIKASALEPGQKVDIDMQNSLDGAFEAIRVTVVF